MSDWKEYKLKEFAVIQTGPFGSQLHAADYVTSGTPSIMPTNIGKRLNIVTDEIVYVDNNDIDRLKKYTVEQNDIVYSRRGDVEKCAFITQEQSGWLCGTGCLRIRFISQNIFPKFCAYYFSAPHIKSWILNSAVGTTMLNLNTTILGELPLLIPEIDEQKRIAEMLSSIDDKIDLLQRQNKTIEQLAEAIFRQQFLMEANESWEETNFGSIIHQVKDRLKDLSAKIEDTKVLSAVKTGELILSEDYFTKQVFSKDIGKYIVVEQFDFAYNPSRINIGSIGMLGEKLTGAVSPVYVVLRPKKNWQYYLKFMLKQQYVKSTIEIYASGSVRQSLDYDSFSKIEIKLPPFEKVEMFNNYYTDSLVKINSNKQQIGTLTNLRDMLLPKLMSGEVRIERNL